VVLDGAGNLYGTTLNGGAANFGVAFKLDPSGNMTLLHTFGTSIGDGLNPWGGTVLDAAGNLYGTTSRGGAYDGGVAFLLDPSGNVRVLHDFAAQGLLGLVLDAAGNLYGTSQAGGIYGKGSIYRIKLH
jgi:uncharacterized repeat protein (TIGR03803 family)